MPTTGPYGQHHDTTSSVQVSGEQQQPQRIPFLRLPGPANDKRPAWDWAIRVLQVSVAETQWDYIRECGLKC